MTYSSATQASEPFFFPHHRIAPQSPDTIRAILEPCFQGEAARKELFGNGQFFKRAIFADDLFGGIFRVKFNDSSWGLFFTKEKKAVTFRSQRFEGRQDADDFADFFTQACGWFTGYSKRPNIERGGICPENGPLVIDNDMSEELGLNGTPIPSMPIRRGLERQKKEPPQIPPFVVVDQHARVMEAVPRDRSGTAARILQSAIRNTPAFITGGVLGAGLRIGGKFALAKLAVTVPGMAAAMASMPVTSAIISAIVVGAVAGGLTKVALTYGFDRVKTQEKGWWRKAFVKGATFGAAGGVIGLGLADLLQSDSVIRGWIYGGAPRVLPDVNPASIHSALVDAPAPTPPAPDIVAATPAPVPQPPVTLNSIPSAPVEPVTPPPAETLPPVATPPAPAYNGMDLLSTEEFNALPQKVQALANSDNPRTIIKFCKEASFWLMNNMHHNPISMHDGAQLIQHGLDVAAQANIHNSIVDHLHADAAYTEAWGVGTDRNVPDALSHARQAGRAVHNFGSKLLGIYHAPKVA